MRKVTYFIICIGMCLMCFFEVLILDSQKNIEIAKLEEAQVRKEAAALQVEKEKEQIQLIRLTAKTETERQKAYQRMRGF